MEKTAKFPQGQIELQEMRRQRGTQDLQVRAYPWTGQLFSDSDFQQVLVQLSELSRRQCILSRSVV